MTDIRQHLPLILATIRKYIAEPDAPEVIRARLRELLPASYALDAGEIISTQGTRSPQLDIVIYDTTLASPQPGEPILYDTRHPLAVIALAHAPDPQTARKLLRAIASAKMLRPGPPSRQNSTHLPQGHPKDKARPITPLKKLLPLGIVAFQQLLAPQLERREELALTLDALLKEQAEHLRPDYLLVQAQACFIAIRR